MMPSHFSIALVTLLMATGAAAQQEVEIRVHPVTSNPTDITAFQGQALFVNSIDGGLWITDGVGGSTQPPSGTRQIPGPTQALGWFAVLHGRAYFAATNTGSATSERRLWVTDGVTAWKAPIQAQLPPGSTFTELQDPSHLTRIGHEIYFSADGGDGKEPWVFDGITARQLYNVNPSAAPNHSSNPQFFAGFPGKVVFQANNGCHGRELWFTDGTGDPNGTYQLMDFRTGPAGVQCNPTHEGRPRFMTAVRTRALQEVVVFIATDVAPGGGVRDNPWVTDFTPVGTQPLIPTASNMLASAMARSGSDLLGHGVWFSAYTPSAGFGVHYTDGTPLGTRLISTAGSGSAPTSLTPVGSRHIYSQTVVTGTGTRVVKDRIIGGQFAGGRVQFQLGGTAGVNRDPSGSPKQFAVANGKVFMASTGRPSHLWVIDNGATAEREAFGCSRQSWLQAEDPLAFSPISYVSGSTTIANPFTQIMVGVPRTWPVGSPAPVIPPIPGFGCEGHLQPGVIIFTPVTTRRHFSTGFPIPGNPAFLDLSLICQAITVSVDPVLAIELSNPVRMTIDDF